MYGLNYSPFYTQNPYSFFEDFFNSAYFQPLEFLLPEQIPGAGTSGVNLPANVGADIVSRGAEIGVNRPSTNLGLGGFMPGSVDALQKDLLGVGAKSAIKSGVALGLGANLGDAIEFGFSPLSLGGAFSNFASREMGVDYTSPAVKGLSFGLGLINPALGVATSVAAPMVGLGIDALGDALNLRPNEDVRDQLESYYGKYGNTGGLRGYKRAKTSIDQAGLNMFDFDPVGLMAKPGEISALGVSVNYGPTFEEDPFGLFSQEQPFGFSFERYSVNPLTGAVTPYSPETIDVDQVLGLSQQPSFGISPQFQSAVARMAHGYGLDYTRSVWGGKDSRARTALARDVASNPGFYGYDSRREAERQLGLSRGSLDKKSRSRRSDGGGSGGGGGWGGPSSTGGGTPGHEPGGQFGM